MTIGEIIRALRINANLTQKELAKKANLKQQHISRIETNLQNLTLNTLSKISLALDTCIHNFIQCEYDKKMNCNGCMILCDKCIYLYRGG